MLATQKRTDIESRQIVAVVKSSKKQKTYTSLNTVYTYSDLRFLVSSCT